MDVSALAALAGNTLVVAAVTDAWEDLRHKLAGLFGRGQPDSKIALRLDATRAKLAAAAPTDLERLRAAEAAQWQTRFVDLLTDHPDAGEELVALVKEIQASVSASDDHSVGAGRDVNVMADHGSVAAGVISGNVTLPGPLGPGPVGS